MLNLVEQDINKNNKNANAEGSVKVVIPLNNDDIQKANLNQENRIEHKKNNKTDKDNKDAANSEKSNITYFSNIIKFYSMFKNYF